MELRDTSNGIIISARCMDVCVCVISEISMIIITNVDVKKVRY